MRHPRYKDLGIVSAKKPYKAQLFWELNNGYLLLVDSTSRRDLLISTDKGDNWDTFDTGSFTDGKISDDRNIIAAFFDRGNDLIYFIGWEVGVDGDKIQCWKLDVSAFTASDIGNSIDADNAPGDAIGIDVWVRDNEIEVLLRDDNGGSLRWEVFQWVDPNWVFKAFQTLQDTLYIPNVIIGTNGFFVTILEATHSATIQRFDGTDLSTRDAIINVDGPSDDNMLSMSYDGIDILSFPLFSTGDAENRLFIWSITGTEETKLAAYNIALMLDRNTAELEKGFSIGASETVYEIKARLGGIRVLQDISSITDAVIIAITDNFLMNNDGDMFEFTDVTNEISTILYTDGIIGILKKGIFTVHPDFHINWNKGDSIKIYDDNDLLEFHGLITDKNRNSRGIYVFKIDSFTNEIYRTTYENAYTGDDSDTKQKDIIDNACDFCYRSSSIVGTTTNYDYGYNRAIIYLFWLARFLERQVPYIEPDGKIWTKAYNGLVATGKSWDIIDNNQEVFFIDIPGLEEIIQGFFDGNSGITRNTIRYKNNATVIRPIAATRDPIEQLQGIITLNEFRDPKLEAATEANQLGDNRYNIWSSDIIFLGLRIKGEGYLQPGKTIEIQNTGQITITQDNFLILSFERDPKNDEYTRMILSDNIIFPSEFTNLQDTTRTQVHTASVQALENQAAIAVAGDNLGDHTATEDLKMAGNDISSSGALAFKVSGDNNDYLEFFTLANATRLKIYGQSTLRFESDQSTDVVFMVRDDDTHNLVFIYEKDNDRGIIRCTDAIRFQTNGNFADYLEFYTVNNIPHIAVRGGSVLYFRDSVAGAWETLHADDFVNETPPMPTKLCTQDILNVKSINGQLDKDSLPEVVKFIDKNGENEGMRLGAMVLHLTKTIQELVTRIKALEEVKK